MALTGTMNYTYRLADGTTRTIENIPNAEIEKLRREHGLTHSEACIAWADGVSPVAADKQVKAPTKSKRQPDEVKRALIAALYEFVADQDNIENAAVKNVERVIAFSIGEDNYELTLSKKRATK